ncbi:helix-turn-helix domain-containing protein [Sandaracinobacteroides saxicola]|uniref:DUF4019 domain-containing protein n=1 Tax=Sandaracinobacteroides saxicola TaxID=2759707 RepID=A0A7G5IIG8_9SPHN|nr:DUF4019 domain-containing protein [Sandaracinobacteroides saxicola]QMW23160.1 DUF4019 domain-containing protein [Sandaracinobacteroides saxicola]
MPDPRLTEKEKQTLRLLAAGHDAKSIAAHLGLSVHTVNERLRDSRHKLGTSSSREAARLLRDQEGAAPEKAADNFLGADTDRTPAQPSTSEGIGADRHPRPGLIIGGIAMLSLLVALAVAASSPSNETPATPVATTAESATVATARHWLALLDAGDWNASYQATGTAFRSLNSGATWAAASEKARAPLGAAISRDLVSVSDVPAPPNGYWMVKFRTRFARRPDAIETVSLEHEGGEWRVVGITIE